MFLLIEFDRGVEAVSFVYKCIFISFFFFS